MTIQNLIDSLQVEVARNPGLKDQPVAIETPAGREFLAGLDRIHDALPGEPELALFVATEYD